MGNVFFNSKLCLHCQEINWINREKVVKELIMGVIWKHVKPGYITCCIYIYVESVIGCQVRNTKWPLLHYRCIPNSSDKVIFSQAARAQCEWKCLNMESCKYININPSNVSCETGIGRCMHLEPSAGYMDIKSFVYLMGLRSTNGTGDSASIWWGCEDTRITNSPW